MDNRVKELLEKLNKNQVSGTNKDKVFQDIISTLESIDLKDPEIKNIVMEYAKSIVDIAIKNEPISEYQTLAYHYITTRLSMDKRGLDVSKITYVHKKPNTNYTAYYNPSDNSMCFVYESSVFLPNLYKNSNYLKLEALCEISYIANHELYHCQQHTNIYKNQNTVDTANPTIYRMIKEKIAREMTLQNNSKYSHVYDSMYNQNHDQFLTEITADTSGYKHAFDLMRDLNKDVYNIITTIPHGTNLKDKFSRRLKDHENYMSITWNHSTNPNNAGVIASHKASMIIDEGISKYQKSKLPELFARYPILHIVYNENGTRKNLADIEIEKQEKIKEILTSKDNTSNTDRQTRCHNVSELYESVIESDPILAIERYLAHLSRISSTSNSYFTDGGTEVKYDEARLHSEIKNTTNKIIAIAQYVEGANRKVVSRLISKYKKDQARPTASTHTDRMLYEEKLRSFNTIEFYFRRNKDILQDIAIERQENDKKKVEYQKAIELLKTLFPGFTFKLGGAYEYVLSSKGIETIPNEKAKYILLERCNKIANLSNSSFGNRNINKILKQHNITINDMFNAISTLYPFDISKETKAKFDKMIYEHQDGLYEAIYNCDSIVDFKPRPIVKPARTTSAPTNSTTNTIPPQSPIPVDSIKKESIDNLNPDGMDCM